MFTRQKWTHNIEILGTFTRQCFTRHCTLKSGPQIGNKLTKRTRSVRRRAQQQLIQERMAEARDTFLSLSQDGAGSGVPEDIVALWWVYQKVIVPEYIDPLWWVYQKTFVHHCKCTREDKCTSRYLVHYVECTRRRLYQKASVSADIGALHNAQIEQFDDSVYNIEPYMIPRNQIFLVINRVWDSGAYFEPNSINTESYLWLSI